MSIRHCLIIFLLFSSSLFSQSSPPIVELTDSLTKKSLVGKMLLIKDNGFSVKDAEQKFIYDKSTLIKTDKIGVSEGTYWVYFKLNSEIAKEYIITIKNWTTSYMEFHIKKETSENFEEKINWQNTLHYKNRKVIHSFELQTFLESNTNYTCLLKITYPRNIYIPLHVYTLDTFYKEQTNQKLKSGLFYGFYILLFLIIIFLYIQLKDTIYFYYGGVVITTLIYVLLQDGMVYEWFNTYFNLYYGVEWILLLTYSFFTTFFVLKFNDLEEYYPKLYKFSKLWIYFIFILLSLFYITNNYYFFMIGNYLKDFSFIFFWIITLILFKKKPYIKYYSIIYGFYALICFLFLLSFNIGFSIISIETVKYAATIKMFLMLFLTLYRFKHIKTEKELLALEKETLLSEKGILIKELNHKDDILSSIKDRKQKSNDFSNKRDKIYDLFDLTKRELDIIEKIYLGKSNKQIAEELNVSLSTIKQYSSRIYKKLEVTSRVELITFLDKI